LIWEQAILITNYLKNYNDVIEKVNECEKHFPDKFNLEIIKGYAEHSINLNDSAIITSNRILKRCNDKDLKVQALNLLAEIYREENDFKKSDEYFNEIIKIDNENLMIRNNYGYYLATRGENLNKALELSQLTIDKEPNNSTYLDTYGWILYKRGKLKEAASVMESVINSGEKPDAVWYEHYGYILKKEKRCKEAVNNWNIAMKIDSTKTGLLKEIENCGK
jgi:Tfp pilus assembly protein PilF